MKFNLTDLALNSAPDLRINDCIPKNSNLWRCSQNSNKNQLVLHNKYPNKYLDNATDIILNFRFIYDI